MENEKRKNKTDPSPTEGEKDVQKQSKEAHELVPQKHPHGDKGENHEHIPRKHPHKIDTCVDTEKRNSVKRKTKIFFSLQEISQYNLSI